MEAYIRDTPVAGFIFLFTIITSLYAFSNQQVYGKFMLHPYSVSRGERVYSIFTSGLIHKDWGHLIMNMISYYFFAFTLERMIGHWQFGLLYIASLALSDLSTIVKHKDHFWYNSLGASGAVSAIVFSYILFEPFASFYFRGFPAVLFGVLYLAYSAYASNRTSNINHDAHFFGALSGIIITIIFYPWVMSQFLAKIAERF
jgi:membrane associated rhomboid family serine protease